MKIEISKTLWPITPNETQTPFQAQAGLCHVEVLPRAKMETTGVLSLEIWISVSPVHEYPCFCFAFVGCGSGVVIFGFFCGGGSGSFDGNLFFEFCRPPRALPTHEAAVGLNGAPRLARPLGKKNGSLFVGPIRTIRPTLTKDLKSIATPWKPVLGCPSWTCSGLSGHPKTEGGWEPARLEEYRGLAVGISHLLMCLVDLQRPIVSQKPSSAKELERRAQNICWTLDLGHPGRCQQKTMPLTADKSLCFP